MATFPPVISPPPNPRLPQLVKLEDVTKYISSDLFNYLTEFYKHSYFIWQRTGGYESNIPTSSESGTTEFYGVININVSTESNIGSVEDILLQYDLLANTLGTDSSFIEVEAFGTFASNANNKRVRLYFGSTVLYDTTSLAANSGSWILNSKIIRTGSSSQKAITTIISDNTLVVDEAHYITSSEDLTGVVNIKCTGESIADDDIVQEGLIIKLFNG